MNATDTKILNALPAGTVISYTGFEGLRYSWRKADDGRWVGRYISAQGSLCSNGIHHARRIVADINTGRDVCFA